MAPASASKISPKPVFGGFGSTPPPVFGAKTDDSAANPIFGDPVAKRSTPGNIFGAKVQDKDPALPGNVFGAKVSASEQQKPKNIFGDSAATRPAFEKSAGNIFSAKFSKSSEAEGPPKVPNLFGGDESLKRSGFEAPTSNIFGRTSAPAPLFSQGQKSSEPKLFGKPVEGLFDLFNFSPLWLSWR